MHLNPQISITNQDAAEAIMAVIYAEAKRRADTITLPRADCALSTTADAAMKKEAHHG